MSTGEETPRSSSKVRGADTADGEPRAGAAKGARPYLAGDVIAGRYRLTSMLGSGGMGAVWLARSLTLDIDVALKVIHREVATPETSQRLLQEARAAARLDHPSIVRVFEFGESEQGDPFIAMELLQGEVFRKHLERKKKLGPRQAVSVLLPVVSALEAAHGKGIIHRDLKPENIVLVENDAGALVPKVLDFGIAKLRTEDAPKRRLTQERTLMGTPDYMSPEQASGTAEVDERTDVWALSVMLYETIAGRLPFDGPTYNALLIAIMMKEPEPLPEAAGSDEALWAIVARGLAKDPGARWATMGDFGKALAEWAIAHGVENDVAGASIEARWLSKGHRRPLSEFPSPAETMAPSRPQTWSLPTVDLRREMPDAPALRETATSSGEPTAEDLHAAGLAPPRPSGRRKYAVAAAAVVAVVAFGLALFRGGPEAASSTKASARAAEESPASSAAPAPAPTVAAPPAAGPAASEVAPASAEASPPTAGPSAAPPGTATSAPGNGPARKETGAAQSKPKETGTKEPVRRPATGFPVPAKPNF